MVQTTWAVKCSGGQSRNVAEYEEKINSVGNIGVDYTDWESE